MTRNDVHSPKNLITEDYEYVYAFDSQAPGFLIGVDMDWWRSITNWAPETAERGSSQCHHCGAWIRYVAILKHVPTGFNIAVGETCLENRFERATAEFQKLRKAATLDRQAQRIRTAGLAFLADCSPVVNALMAKHDSEVAAFTADLDSEIVSTERANSFISDVRRKLWLYGSLFPNQLAAVERQYPRAIERAAQRAVQATEVHVPAKSGKVSFEGVCVKTAWNEGDYGSYKVCTIKVTETEGVWFVRMNQGSKVIIERGDTVRATATLIPSDGEWSHFAKGKRPSKVTVTGHTDIPENDALSD